LELLKYDSWLSSIQKAAEISKITEIKEEINNNVKGKYLPTEKSVNNLYQVLKEQETLINLRGIINSIVPTDITEINGQLEQLTKLSTQATKAEQKAYDKLKKEIDDKELELMKAKHQQVNSKGEL